MSLLVINKNMTLGSQESIQEPFGGNQLAMVAGAKALEIIKRDKLVEHANCAGQYFRHGLEELRRRVDCIAEVRGKGLMLGMELKNQAVKSINSVSQFPMGNSC